MPSRSDEQPYPEPMGNILLVDDDPTVRGVVSDYLRAAGHSITEASDGISALELADGCDLVILDLMLPGIRAMVKRWRRVSPRTPPATTAPSSRLIGAPSACGTGHPAARLRSSCRERCPGPRSADERMNRPGRHDMACPPNRHRSTTGHRLDTGVVDSGCVRRMPLRSGSTAYREPSPH